MSKRFLVEYRPEDVIPPVVPELDKENTEKITKECDKYIKTAIKNKDPLSITSLFSEHPFYSRLEIERKPDVTIAKYYIYSPKKNQWKEYATASFEKIDRDYKIYERIAENIEKIYEKEAEEKDSADSKPEDIFEFE